MQQQYGTLGSVLSAFEQAGPQTSPEPTPQTTPPQALPTSGTTSPGLLPALVLLVLAGIVTYYWYRREHKRSSEQHGE
jgi:uncharacterized protein HemX